MEFSRQEYWNGLLFSSPGALPNPGIEPGAPALQVDSLPSEPRGNPKNTGVGSLSLLQGIFLTQGLNQGLLYCWRILYQLRYREAPGTCDPSAKTSSACRRNPPARVGGHRYSSILALSSRSEGRSIHSGSPGDTA